ncbi:hypothetical protein CcaverHIS002_0306860 [Cutaneotrichosporon cavernicola]|nr:hypothetical protein CcaverHIS002_0306860 [Cutaneotrichosporon cavernicola]
MPLALGTRVLRPPHPPRPIPVRPRTYTSSYNLFGPFEGQREAPPALRLDLNIKATGDMGGGSLAIVRPGVIDGDPECNVLCICESPDALHASDHDTFLPSTSTTTRPRRASFTFGDKYSPEIIARAAAACHADAPAVAFQTRTQSESTISPRLKSILKKERMNSDASLPFGPRKRVTWSDEGSGSSSTLQTLTETPTQLAIELTEALEGQKKRTILRMPRIRVMQSLRRHSTDAATVLRRVAGSVASAGNAIPGVAYFRQPWDYHYPSSEDEEYPVRPSSPDIDWIAAGQAYTEEDLQREYPPLAIPDETVHEQRGRGRASLIQPALSRVQSAPAGGTRPSRAPSDASDTTDDSEPHFDPRRFQLPPGILEGRYRRPVFESHPEPTEPSPIERPTASRNASTTSNDTLPSLDSSFSSLASEGPEGPPTPSGSILLSDDMPEGAVVIGSRPKWSRHSAYTGSANASPVL